MGRVGLGMWLYSNLEDRVLNVSHLVREREKKDATHWQAILPSPMFAVVAWEGGQYLLVKLP